MAQPFHPVFAPKQIITPESEVDLDTLRQVINNSEVNEAILVYNLLNTKNIEIPADVKQDLLELVCFYNEENPIPVELFEERDSATKERRSKQSEQSTWKDNSFAESLFDSLETKTPEAYSAILCGLYKHNHKARTAILFQEALEKQIPLDIEVFNYAIRATNMDKAPLEMRWNSCLDLLKQINDRKLKPNLNTLNAVLYTINGSGHYALIRQYALQTIAEFKKLGIEPSLGSWFIILRTFCREKTPVSHILVAILNEIENKSFTIQHPLDTYFFFTAMAICNMHLNDEALAHRLDAFFNVGDNSLLIGDSQQENAYYRHYLNVCCRNEPLPKFLELYDQLVPNTFSLESSFLKLIFEKINLSGAIEVIPKIWSDMVVGGTFNDSQEHILSLMVDNEPQLDIEIQRELPKKFADVAWDIYNRLVYQSKVSNSFNSFSSTALSNIIILLLRGGRNDDATTVMKLFLDKDVKILGGMLPQALEMSLELCVKQKQPSLAIELIEYSITTNVGEPNKLAKIVMQSMTLDERYLYKMANLVGTEVVKSFRK